MIDEELWIVLNRLEDFYVAETAQVRGAREAVRHIVPSVNLHYRRYKRFAGEPLCSSAAARRSGLRRSTLEPTCHTCLDVARKMTEIPRPFEMPLPSGLHQLSLFPV
ncbi:MAG TPA: hypothetical protein V6D05_04415 [Stenomitos sp.]